MAEQSAFDPNNLENGKLLQAEGILDQLNLPPAMITFMRQNQRLLWVIFIVVAAIVVGTSVFSTYRTYTINKAASALNTVLTSEGNKEELLEAFIKEYGSTASGVWGKIQLAHLQQEKGEGQKAIASLEAVNLDVGATEPLKPLLAYNLANLYEKEKKYDKALARYKELESIEGFQTLAHKSMGRVNETMGNTEEAVAQYTKYIDMVNAKNLGRQGDPNVAMVQARVNKLTKK